MDFVWLLLGLIILIVGGEFLVKGAVTIALKLKISTLVVGMTVVSFGTSAPELLVSLKAALEGHPDIAIGNVVGSNISNLALVLGLTALIFPIAVDRNSIRVDWPAMMIASLLFYLFGTNLSIERWEGIVMVILLVAFVYFLIRDSRKKKKEDDEIDEEKKTGIGIAIFYLLLGSTGLVFGAEWLVDGAVGIARDFGVSEHIISVTIIAFGTSVPELATSSVAAFKKETDISIGNLIGSNIFNILCILGITATVKEISINPNIFVFDIIWMLGISALVLPLMVFKRKITRLKGGILFLAYLSYYYFLIF